MHIHTHAHSRIDIFVYTLFVNILQGHFEESQFEQYRKDGKQKLKPKAIPTLFDVTNPPKLVTNKRKSKHTKQTPLKTEKAHNNDHSYVKTHAHNLEDKLDTTMDVNILEGGTSVPDSNIEINKPKKLTILSRYQQQIRNIKKKLATTKAKLRTMQMKHTILQQNLKKILIQIGLKPSQLLHKKYRDGQSLQ